MKTYTICFESYSSIKPAGLNRDGSTKLDFVDYSEVKEQVVGYRKAMTRIIELQEQSRIQGRKSATILRGEDGRGRVIRGGSRLFDTLDLAAKRFLNHQ